MPNLGDCTTLENCLLELVLNALKAQATAIAVRIYLPERRIQVADNGHGISRNALKYVAERSAKIEAGPGALEKTDIVTDGHLAKIRELSSCLIVMSRSRFTSRTYGKLFSNDKDPEVRRIENRPSCGTTVVVYALRELCSWGREIDSFAVKSIIVHLSLVNRQVSFSVRDDMRGSIILRIGKYQTQKRLLRVIFQKPLNSDLQCINTQKLGKVEVSGFWGVECTEVQKMQQILLNLRPVDCPVLEKFMVMSITKTYCSHEENANVFLERIFFLLYVECPDTEYNITLKGSKPTVNFHQVDQILDSVERCLRKTEVKSVIPTRTCRPLGRILGVKQKTSFSTKVSRRGFQKTANTTEVKRRLRTLREVEESTTFDNKDSIITNRDIAPIVQTNIEDSAPKNGKAFPVVSSHWPENYAEAAGAFKILESVKQSQNPIDESLGNSENTIEAESLPAAKEYQYDNHGVLWISQKCNEKLSHRVEETYDIDCSQWSDWIYEPVTRNRIGEKSCDFERPVLYKRFKFLPLTLHALLPFLNKKLINRDLSEDAGMPVNLNFNNRRQDLDVRPCTRRSSEFRLKTESLKAMKVLNQVNREFIVALTKQDDKKLVVVVDQHAMHERIRYENLLRAYKSGQKNQQLISTVLQRPIIISDLSASACSLLSSNLDLLTRYGLNLASRNDTTLLIFAIPRCFAKKSYHADNAEVEVAVRKLLQEVLDDLTANGTAKHLPLTIHDAIASEACHGAIKFGDLLTLKECESLITCWGETDAPNRCAHGRPSAVPLLDLSSRRKTHREFVGQGKLNFASLRRFRQTTRKTLAMTSRYHPYVTLTKNCESRFYDDDDKAFHVDTLRNKPGDD